MKGKEQRRKKLLSQLSCITARSTFVIGLVNYILWYDFKIIEIYMRHPAATNLDEPILKE